MGYHPHLTLIYRCQLGGGTVNGVKYSEDECWKKKQFLMKKHAELKVEQNMEDADAWRILAEVSLHSSSLLPHTPQ